MTTHVGGAVIAALVVAVAGCSRNHEEQGASSTPAVVASDTLVGILSEVGSDPTTWLSLRPASGASARRLSGDSSRALRSVLGAEVWINGEQRDGEFIVHAFEVRSVNGMPVDDGLIRLAGTALEIVMRSGQRRGVPSSLERSVGSRVWITRPEAGRAPSFGVIRAQ